MRRPPALAAAALLLLAVAGCSSPDSGSADDGDQPGEEFANDPWLTDDLEYDAALTTGSYEGMDMLGLTCDTAYVTADSFPKSDDRWASVQYSPDSSGISYRDPAGISQATGGGITTPALPAAVTVAVSGGYFHIGDGGENRPGWGTSMDLELVSVPVPESGCGAALFWVMRLTDAGAGADEVFRQLTEVGLKDVSATCPDLGETWIPPDIACEDWEDLYYAE